MNKRELRADIEEKVRDLYPAFPEEFILGKIDAILQLAQDRGMAVEKVTVQQSLPFSEILDK